MNTPFLFKKIMLKSFRDFSTKWQLWKISFQVLADLNGCWLSVVKIFVVFQNMCKLSFIKYLWNPMTMKTDAWEAYFKRIPIFKSPLSLSSHIFWLIKSDMKVLYFKMQLPLLHKKWSRTQAQWGIL